MLKKILIANRGEIACRVIRTARRLGIGSVAVYSEADSQALHVEMADEAVWLGPPPASRSYLLVDKIIEAAVKTGADSIHPGYGFLSENAGFAAAVEAAGLIFIGPNQKAIELMGDKIISKRYADQAGVSTIPGFPDAIEAEDKALDVAREIGFPVMIKAAAGGGGKGMRVALDEKDLIAGFGAAGREAKASFGDGRVFIEKYIEGPRHIEIQILCDKHGHGVHLGERECSIQRRNQKVIEEAPSSFLTETIRAEMGRQALMLAEAVGYDSAGTVEFVMGRDRDFYFLEMNTRLQVEHPVTEFITGLDLVEEMIRIASGEKLRHRQSDIKIDGWAMEARLYSEDPENGFVPSTGRLSWFRPPLEAEIGAFRLDSGVAEGDQISMFYDPMIAKLITHAPSRGEAITQIARVLNSFRIEGVRHNLLFLNAIFHHPDFVAGDIDTGFIGRVWPDGFKSMPLDEAGRKVCLGAALFIYLKAQARNQQLEGARWSIPRLVTETPLVAHIFDGHDSAVCDIEFEWQGRDMLTVRTDGGDIAVESASWRAGGKLWSGSIDGRDITLQLENSNGGVQLIYCGARVEVHVRSKMAEAIAAQLPAREADMSQTELLCPMPGQITAIYVQAGDQVSAGQTLLTIEAMKMENTLHAENNVTIKKIHCQEGQSVGFEDLLMEFEISEQS